MELSAEILASLILGVGVELMLFASVGMFLFGIDDLFLDIMWFTNRRAIARNRAENVRRDMAPPAAGELAGPIAIFVPAWRESEIIGRTLREMLDAWRGEDIRLYVGCYPNDVATLFAASPTIAADDRCRLVIADADGPTTKADNLNSIWAAMLVDERSDNRPFAAVVLHDAEDIVHPLEIALYRRHLGRDAMVQIPVVPATTARSRWVAGHYGDEFAYSHGLELPLRSHLGIHLPSAGVGCAIRRGALQALAIDRHGFPFSAHSLTEDYEMGLHLARLGLTTRFVDARAGDGSRIVSAGQFPARLEAAVRQKSRWIAGMAFAGWDHLGWMRMPGRAGADGQSRRFGAALLSHYYLWRDRKAPLAALLLASGYGAALLLGPYVLWSHFHELPPLPQTPALQLLMGCNLALLLWRLGMRVYATTAAQGVAEGLRAAPRMFISNIVAILAARRAFAVYFAMLRTSRVVWDKTDHLPAEAIDAGGRP